MFKQTLAPFIALLGLNSAAAAQTTAVQPAATQPPPAQACTLPKIADTAPLEQLPSTDLVTVPVTMNGTTKQFLLDLALKRPTEVSPAAMAELGLPSDPKQTELLQYGVNGIGTMNYQGAQVPVYDVRDKTGAGSLQDRVRVGSLGVGAATAKHLLMAVAPKGAIGQSASYAGYLTGDFFRQYDVELDFAGKQMSWLTPTSCTDPDQVVFWAHREVAIIPVTLAQDGRLQTQALVKGHVIEAEIDTTSARTVMRRDIADRYVGLTEGKDMTPVEGLEDGMHVQVYASIFPQLTFAGGGITALNVPVLIQDYSMIPAIYRQSVIGHREPSERIPDLVIGMDVLSQLHMYVVPGQSRIYVTSAE